MVYVTVSLDHAVFQMLGMLERENECVKCNGIMPRKAEGGGFWCVVK
jgi:hypothetical protein